MSSVAEVAPIDELLAPIPGENPAGEDIRYTPLYDQIREARRSDDDSGLGEWAFQTKAAEWPKLIKLASGALATKSKDLQLCAWLAEAFVRVHGFAGLRDGLKITTRVLEEYWDTLYPEIDEGDLEARAGLLEWMNDKLLLPTKTVPITRASGDARYSYIDWEIAMQFLIPENLEGLEYDEQQRVIELKQRAAVEGKITSEEWRAAKDATPRAFYEEAYAIVSECWDEINALDRTVDEKFAPNPPGLGTLKKAIGDVHALVERLLKEKGGLQPIVEEDESTGDADSPEGEAGDGARGARSGGSLTAAGAIRSRQEALKRLGEVAEYFRQAEPHSPVAYLLQRAIRWEQMPLDMWLRAVIKNEDVLDRLSETLGFDAESAD
jgi:type VI secretion system protein ImpA